MSHKKYVFLDYLLIAIYRQIRRFNLRREKNLMIGRKILRWDKNFKMREKIHDGRKTSQWKKISWWEKNLMMGEKCLNERILNDGRRISWTEKKLIMGEKLHDARKFHNERKTHMGIKKAQNWHHYHYLFNLNPLSLFLYNCLIILKLFLKYWTDSVVLFSSVDYSLSVYKGQC